MRGNKHADKLLVTVVGCRNIHGGGVTRSDPYVRVFYSGESEKTHTDKEGGKNPNFNEALELSVKEPPYLLEVEVYNDHTFLPDNLLAKGVVDFTEAVENGEMHGSYTLRHSKAQRFGSNENGTVELNLKYSGSPKGNAGAGLGAAGGQQPGMPGGGGYAPQYAQGGQ